MGGPDAGFPFKPSVSSPFFSHPGKNWDLSAALSDFEQLRQGPGGRPPRPGEPRGCRAPEQEAPSAARPPLQRQDDAVQGACPSLQPNHQNGSIR